MFICCQCCVLGGRGLCVGLITRPDESHRLWCVWVWSRSLDNEDALAHWGQLRHGGEKTGRGWICYLIRDNNLGNLKPQDDSSMKTHFWFPVFWPQPKKDFRQVCEIKRTFSYTELVESEQQRPCWWFKLFNEFYVQQFIQKNPTRWNNVSKFIIPHLYEALHVSGDTPPIIKSLKLHRKTMVLYTWKVVGRVVAGPCQADYTLNDSVQQLHIQQPSTYANPETTSAVFGSWWWAVCRPKHVELHINME